jgi:hypothetical protein
VSIQDRLLDSLRRCCQVLPDRREGRNTTYAMVSRITLFDGPGTMQIDGLPTSASRLL